MVTHKSVIPSSAGSVLSGSTYYESNIWNSVGTAARIAPVNIKTTLNSERFYATYVDNTIETYADYTATQDILVSTTGWTFLAFNVVDSSKTKISEIITYDEVIDFR